MNDVVPFQFEDQEVRVVTREDEPWWVLADVCRVLGIGNNADASRRLDDDEKGVDSIDTPGGRQNAVTINESGLYSLVLTSRKPEAKRFKKWVTSEVIPAIRKTGRYGAPALNLRDPSQMAIVAAQLVDINQELRGKVDDLSAANARLNEEVERYHGFARHLTAIKGEIERVLHRFVHGEPATTMLLPAPSTPALGDYLPTIDILKELGADRAGRHHLTSISTRQLKELALQMGNPPIPDPHHYRLLFHKDVIAAWRSASGDVLVAEHQSACVEERERRAAAQREARQPSLPSLRRPYDNSPR